MTVITKYYDASFSRFAYQNTQYVHYNNYELIPTDCDVVGTTFWSGKFDEHIKLVEMLLSRTKQLLIFAPEPVNTNLFVNFINGINLEPRVKLFANAVLNFETPSNYVTTPNWFIIPENCYKTQKWAVQLLKQLEFTRPKIKKFDCLLGKQKKHRDFINDRYLSSAYRDDIIFTYFKTDILSGSWNFELQNNLTPCNRIDINGELAQISAILPVDIYNNSYYSIVAETTVSNKYSHFTEKTAKPILAKRLFVMFAGQHFLKNLRSLGFQTFDSVIDESYDELADNTERFTAAWNQVEQLCQLDPAWVLSQIEDILYYNQQHFLATDWHASLRQTINGDIGQG